MTPADFRAARQSLGWTQEEAGIALGGLHQTTIARIEAGRLPISGTLRLLLLGYASGRLPKDWAAKA